jgi:hypothetical protein
LDSISGILSLPDELFISILWSCTLDSLLNLLLVRVHCLWGLNSHRSAWNRARQTNKRLHRVSADILGRYVKALYKHGLRFLPHQAGTDETVRQLQETLEITAASWINCKFKRRVSRLREATGSTETFIFDNCMMRCRQEGPTRSLALFSLDATYEDPVGQNARVKLQVGSHRTQRNGKGPISVECYDVGQDLLAFAHVRRSSSVLLSAANSTYVT